MSCSYLRCALAVLASVILGGCAGSLSRGGWLDVEGRSTTDEVPGLRGALVEHVGADGSDLCVGDVIVRFEDRAVSGYADVVRAAFDAGAGRDVTVSVSRGGEVRDVHVRTAAAEEQRHVGLGLPLLQPPLSREPGGLGLDSLLDVELGPDESGFMLFRLLGFESGPRGWDARLLLVHFGSLVRLSIEAADDGAAASTSAGSGVAGGEQPRRPAPLARHAARGRLDHR